jgi:hypothetical protein
MWCALWTFIFSYGPPAGGVAVMAQIIVIPPVVLVLLAGLRLAAKNGSSQEIELEAHRNDGRSEIERVFS